MITPVLLSLFDRDLEKLKNEILQYKTEEHIWDVRDGITNSGGNLCLHITGNLLHFLGAVLNNTGYVRNRNAEFTLKNIPRQKLIDKVEETRNVVRDTLEQISKKEMESNYPQLVFEQPVTTEYLLIHLLGHLDYHLGQVNYHRRLIDG